MYITNNGKTYYNSASQCHTKAPFLIIVQHSDKPLGPLNFRALVTNVALRQLGHFMMGIAKIGSYNLVLSGAYGGDGLPVTIDSDELFAKAIPIPKWLYDEWANGDGWNSAGKEAHAMKKWAVEIFLKEIEYTYENSEFYEGQNQKKFSIKKVNRKRSIDKERRKKIDRNNLS